MELGILNDLAIKKLGPTHISPYSKGNVQPASYDLTLSDVFYLQETTGVIDPRKPVDKFFFRIQVPNYMIAPGEFLLGGTVESVTIPPDLLGRIEGRSSFARLGIEVHVSAGFIDPGFEGRITLEIVNEGKLPVILYPGDRICQICFEEMTEPADKPYGTKEDSKYQRQNETQISKVYKDQNI